MDHSTFQFSISTNIKSPFSHSAKVVRTLSSTASSYSRGLSSLIVAGMYVPSPACLILWKFWAAFGRTVTVGSPLTIFREKRQTQT